MTKDILYSGLDVSYPGSGDYVRDGHFLNVGEDRIYLAHGVLETYSRMDEEELSKIMGYQHPGSMLILEREGITPNALKKTLERAFEEETKLVEEFQKGFE